MGDGAAVEKSGIYSSNQDLQQNLHENTSSERKERGIERTRSEDKRGKKKEERVNWTNGSLNNI